MKQIPLGNGRFAMVDEEDYEYANQHRWFAEQHKHTTYAMSTLGEGQRTGLHTYLMEPSDDMEVDHKDRNGLNCTTVNMRLCTRRQNMFNRVRRNDTTGYRGVTETPSQGFKVQIRDAHGVRRYVGIFNSAQEAARAYDTAAVEYHGEFATLNFPEEHPDGNDPETYSRRTALRIAACV
jgi:hypothetical protein